MKNVPINTLAQSGTNDISSTPEKPNITVLGNGSDLNDNKAQKGKAKEN